MMTDAEIAGGTLLQLQLIQEGRGPRLWLGGDAEGVADLLLRLTGLPYQLLVTRGPRVSDNGATLLWVPSAEDTADDFAPPAWAGAGLFWNRFNDASAAVRAYRAGVRTVLDADFDVAVLPALLQGRGEEAARAVTPVRGRLRRLERGEHIILTENQVLEVKRGLLRCMTMREDGAEVLLGLLHAGDIMLGHDPDHCQVTTIAHIDTTVSVQRWEEAVTAADFHHKLLARICHLEHWAAILAKPRLEERLACLAELLATKCDCEPGQDPFSSLRLTHEQLANALGSARTSITRALAKQRRREA